MTGTGSRGCSITDAGLVTITGAAVADDYCIIEARLSADATYAAAGPISQSFHVAKAAGSIDIDYLPTTAAVGGSFTPTYSGSFDGIASTISSTLNTCTVSEGVVDYDAAGTCTVHASVTEGSNYTAATGGNHSFTISLSAPDFTFDLASLPAKTYGAESFSVAGYANSTNSSGAEHFTLGTGTHGCSVTGEGMVTITGAALGTEYCVIEASMDAAGGYSAAGPISQSFNIAKAALTVTADNQTMTHDGGAPTFAVQYSAFAGSDNSGSLTGTVSYTFAGTGTTTYGPSTTLPTGAGSYSITPGGLSSGDYDISFIAGSLTISKAPSSVSIENKPDGGVVGGGFTISYATLGDGTPSTVSTTPTICTVTGLEVSYIGSGICSLEPSISEGADHLAATGVIHGIVLAYPDFESSCTYTMNPKNGQYTVNVTWDNAYEAGVTMVQVSDGRVIERAMNPTVSGAFRVNVKSTPTGYGLWGGANRKDTGTILVPTLSACTHQQ